MECVEVVEGLLGLSSASFFVNGVVIAAETVRIIFFVLLADVFVCVVIVCSRYIQVTPADRIERRLLVQGFTLVICAVQACLSQRLLVFCRHIISAVIQQPSFSACNIGAVFGYLLIRPNVLSLFVHALDRCVSILCVVGWMNIFVRAYML